jgi:hypothetical protein
MIIWFFLWSVNFLSIFTFDNFLFEATNVIQRYCHCFLMWRYIDFTLTNPWWMYFRRHARSWSKWTSRRISLLRLWCDITLRNPRVLKMCRRFRRLLSHFRQLKIYRAWVFQQFLCLCELSLSRFVDLYLLIDYFYYCNQPNTNKYTIF